MNAPSTPHVDRTATDRGAAAVWVLIMVPALVLVAGLVADGGAVMAKHEQAQNIAEQAARAGADQLNDASLRNGGPPQIDAVAARSAATRYVHAAGATGTVAVTGATVTVTTHMWQPMRILDAIGVSPRTVTGKARARSIGGITRELP